MASQFIVASFSYLGNHSNLDVFRLFRVAREIHHCDDPRVDYEYAWPIFNETIVVNLIDIRMNSMGGLCLCVCVWVSVCVRVKQKFPENRCQPFSEYSKRWGFECNAHNATSIKDRIDRLHFRPGSIHSTISSSSSHTKSSMNMRSNEGQCLIHFIYC